MCVCDFHPWMRGEDLLVDGYRVPSPATLVKVNRQVDGLVEFHQALGIAASRSAFGEALPVTHPWHAIARSPQDPSPAPNRRRRGELIEVRSSSGVARPRLSRSPIRPEIMSPATAGRCIVAADTTRSGAHPRPS
jgi:hypothetical protein